MHKKITATLLLLLIPLSAIGQQNRIRDYNQIGWYVYTGDHKVSKKWQLHTEYQWRRTNFITAWQQSLARLGATYKLSDKVKTGFGYTLLTTYPYGDYPTAGTGAPYSEHRIHEDIQIADTVGIVYLTHRFRLEQRWISELVPDGSHKVDFWDYQNRVRYQIEGTLPLKGRTIDNHEFFLSFFDELFIGFGRSVANNVFNQNRIYGGIGYQFADNFKLDLGYINQITQHPESDPVTGNPVFEFNNGFRLGVTYDIDFTK